MSCPATRYAVRKGREQPGIDPCDHPAEPVHQCGLLIHKLFVCAFMHSCTVVHVRAHQGSVSTYAHMY